MCIISFERRFIFLKTRKVAGTSIEAALRPLTGPEDIVPCVTPRDEYYSAIRGEHSKNYAINSLDERKYTELVLAQDFEGAMEHLKNISTKYVSHMNIGKIENIVSEYGLKLSDFYVFTVERHPYSWMISSVAYNNAKYNSGTLNPISRNRILTLVKQKAADPQFLQTINWHMYTRDDQICVDRILRYENLQDELLATLSDIGIDVKKLQLPELKTNVRHMDPDELLDAEAKRLVAKNFEKVFAALGYET